MKRLVKKVCMLGRPQAGKTSLVRRSVEGKFSEDYLTTIGVLISRKKVYIEKSDCEVEFIIWDIEGANSTESYPADYFKGTSAFIFVGSVVSKESMDGLAKIWLDSQEMLKATNHSAIAFNKIDLLKGESELLDLQNTFFDKINYKPDIFFGTSAKNDLNVDALFKELAMRIAN